MIYYINPDFLGKAQKGYHIIIKIILCLIAKQMDKSLISIKGKSYSLVPNVTLKGLTADENIKNNVSTDCIR